MMTMGNYLDENGDFYLTNIKPFSPDKVNYGAYGDTGKHCHVHIVPKYKDGFEWGGTFAMNPKQKILSEPEYAEMIAKIKAAL